MAEATCKFKKSDGTRCKRSVDASAQYCWQHARGLGARWRALTKNQAVGFTLAVTSLVWTVAYPFIGPYLASLLPGPQVLAVVSKTKAPDGCVGYMVNLSTSKDGPIDRLDLTVQFPGDIVSRMFGATRVAQFPSVGKVGLSAFELGKDASGGCKVVQAATSPSVNMTATVIGNGTIQMIGAGLLPSTSVAGMVVLSPPSFHPTEMREDGSYTYSKLGFSVTKGIEIRNIDAEKDQ
jgi:hypothetical protein